MALKKKSAVRVELGKRYRDTITGFEGVATGRYEYLHGCVRWQLTGVHPQEGGPKECVFDEPQLEAVTGRSHPTSRGTGGPKDAPSRPTP